MEDDLTERAHTPTAPDLAQARRSGTYWSRQTQLRMASRRDGDAVISVRRVRPADAAALKAVRLAALKDTPSAFGSTYAAESQHSEEHWAERSFAGSRGSERTTFFAEDQGVVVGLIGAYRAAPSDERVELVSTWAAPTHRRRGVGRVLIEAVIAWAEETGGTHVGLWVTLGNAAAEDLYQSMSFMPTGERRPLPSDPSKNEVRMDRSLR